MYYSPIKNPLLTLPYIQVQSPIDERNLIIQPYPYKTNFSYHSPLEQSLYLVIKGYEHFEIEQSTTPATLFVANRRPTIGFDPEEDIMIAVTDSSGTSVKTMGDFVIYKGQKYIVTSVNERLESLSLTKVEKNDKPIGTATDFWISPFTLTTLAEKTISTPGNKEYTLLDFWGTWCGPCLELTPRIKTLEDNNRDKVELLSIALDDDNKKVNDYIRDHKMEWNHLIESFDNAPYKLTKRFGVTAFPTFILIDRQGKIIFRGDSQKALDEVIRILNQRTITPK